ncbi:MAG: peptidoglycan-binding protein [Clostridiales bacterium]|nr:peptidoglycan-binding protein [Clostridiales bacterium]
MKKRFAALLMALVLLCTTSIALADAADLPVHTLGSRTLETKLKGTDVVEAQALLATLGYYTGKLDGIYGSGTKSAVLQFQRRNGLHADGKIGPLTLDALQSSNAVGKADPDPFVTLMKGASGEKVKELQRELRSAYYYAGEIDGVFGADVERAVKWFQASAGLTVDGKVGKLTRNALFNRTAKIFNGGIPIRALSSGARGYDVYVLQQKLASLNYLTIAPSGYYGSDTVAAVKALQTANGLKADGKAGAVVRRLLWPTTVDSEEQKENMESGTPDDPYTDRTLRNGSYGKDVANMQMRLKAAGYLLGNADGIFGPKTKAAVIALQKDYGLKQDGVVGPQTWAIVKTLNVGNAEQDVVQPGQPSVGANVKRIEFGNTGAAVKKLQQQLIQLGYLAPGGDDGKFGNQTKKALERFQAANGLQVDGIAGTKTFVKLNEKLGVQWDIPVG